MSWDTLLTIRPDLKSLPSGTLQDRPDNSTVSVREAAQLMISISDNTGADLLIDKVGRARVEAQVGRWSGHTALNRPFLTTRELFLLKGADYPRLAKKYLSLDRARRYRYLATTVARTPLSAVTPWDRPRDIGALEWFASPGDVCRAFAGLSALNTPPIDEIMSANDAGLGLDAEAWPTVWYKGGGEPGVLSMGFLARDAAKQDVRGDRAHERSRHRAGRGLGRARTAGPGARLVRDAGPQLIPPRLIPRAAPDSSRLTPRA